MKREDRNKNRTNKTKVTKDVWNHRTANNIYHKRQYNDNHICESNFCCKFLAIQCNLVNSQKRKLLHSSSCNKASKQCNVDEKKCRICCKNLGFDFQPINRHLQDGMPLIPKLLAGDGVSCDIKRITKNRRVIKQDIRNPLKTV